DDRCDGETGFVAGRSRSPGDIFPGRAHASAIAAPHRRRAFAKADTDKTIIHRLRRLHRLRSRHKEAEKAVVFQFGFVLSFGWRTIREITRNRTYTQPVQLRVFSWIALP